MQASESSFAQYTAPEVLRLPHLENLSPAQEKFLLAWDENLYRAFFGGRQTGKTDVGIDDDLLNAMFRYPGQQGAIFVPDYPRSIEIRERILKYVPDGLRKWNGSDRIWRFRCPEDPEVWSPVVMRSLNEEDAPRSFTFQWAHFDEVALIKEMAYRNALACLATTGEGDKPGPHTCTTTHKGRGFVWKDFISQPTPDHWYVECESRENPVFPDAYFQALADKHGYDSPFFKQEYRGLASAFVGQAIPQFERTNEVHVNGYRYDPDLPLFKLWDFGFWPAPTVCTWMQKRHDDFVVFLGCKVWYQTEREEILDDDNLRGVPQRWADADFIDPDGAKGQRGSASGDRGWLYAMKGQGRNVRYTRRVGEGEGLNLIRTACRLDRMGIASDGEGSDLLIEAFETAELNENVEDDKLKDNQHPQADIIDTARYGFANLFGGGPKPKAYTV